MKLGKYSIGIGDRFSHQGEAQLAAIMKAKSELGIDISPVWNKSNREHTYVHTVPEDTRKEADAAVKVLGFKGEYFVDADHINLNNVDKFLSSSNFFTLDVADYIGKSATDAEISKFLADHKKFVGTLTIPGISHPFEITADYIE
ncbi:MAG TPA: tagaturonate epimerase family protein, partial [Bacteroidales bacterium]